MNLYLFMKLLHVLAAFWMISGVVGRGFTFWQAGKAKDVRAVHALLQISEFFQRYAVIPVSLAVLIFGLVVTRNKSSFAVIAANLEQKEITQIALPVTEIRT